MVPTRQLGRNGPQIPAIGLGLMSFAGWYSQSNNSQDASQQFLDRAHEIGETFWDTADIYGDSEDRVGAWFKRTGKRDDIFLATKFSIVVSGDGGRGVRNDPEYVKQACAKSLSRLGVDTIDLYYCHRIDDQTPVEHMIKAMAELKDEGKIRYLGLSECSADTIRRAHAVHPISAYQVEYSPLFLDIESEEYKILQTCRELGITVIAYSPVGRGLLSGQFKTAADVPANDWRMNVPKLKNNLDKILELSAQITAVGAKHNATAAQVCLAWISQQGNDIIPIPGTSTIKYLEQNTAAADIKLSDDELALIRKYAVAADLPGDRYPSGTMTEILFRNSVPLQ